MFKQLALVVLGASAALGQVSAVISDLNSIKSQTDSLTAALKSFDGTVAGGVPILTATNKLKTTTQAAIKAANAAGTVSESDQADVLKAAEALYPSIISSLQAFVSQKSAFAKAGLTSTAASQLKSLAGLSNQLGSALASKATGAYAAPAKQLASLVNDAFSSAESGQSPQAGSLPSIPSPGGSGSGSSSAAMSSAAATSAPAKTTAKASSYAASSAAASSYAASTPAATPSTPVAPASSAPAASTAPAPAPSYTGAAGKVVSNVGGAVLLAAAAFAL